MDPAAEECKGHHGLQMESTNGFSSDEEIREKREYQPDEDWTKDSEDDEDANVKPYFKERRSHGEARYKKHKRRGIKRSYVIMPDRQSYSITDPSFSTWVCGTTPSKLITLNPTGKMAKVEYDLVLKQFTGAVQKPMNYQVQKIEKIVNGCLWKRYKKSCDFLRSEAGHVNERMLFHGTGAFQGIIDNGFDERYAQNGFYGFGIYFSPLSSKSNGYSPIVNGYKHILLCRVALGNVHRAPTYQSFSHPPPGFNAVEGTVIAATNDCVEIIIFRGEQAYPEYLITYL